MSELQCNFPCTYTTVHFFVKTINVIDHWEDRKVASNNARVGNWHQLIQLKPWTLGTGVLNYMWEWLLRPKLSAKRERTFKVSVFFGLKLSELEARNLNFEFEHGWYGSCVQIQSSNFVHGQQVVKALVSKLTSFLCSNLIYLLL